MEIESKYKFFRNILIGMIGLIVVAFILNTMPGYERDQYIGITDLIVNDENKTQNLINKILIEEERVYLSLEDIKNLFDSNIFYDTENNQIITTGKLKVAMFNVNTNQLFINNSVQQTNIIKKENVQYVPLNELQEVYGISVKYIQENDVLIVDKSEKGIITANIAEDTEIKYKPRGLSKNIGKAKLGEKVRCYYTTSKGWRLIRTETGLLGYVKANTLLNEQIIKPDETKEIQTKEVSLSLSGKEQTTIYTEIETKIQVQNWKDLNNSKLGVEKWIVINNEYFQQDLKYAFANYNNRNQYINTIIETAKQNNINAIILNLEKVEEGLYNRFILEIAPKLRNNNIRINVVKNENITEESIIGIVDFIIK